MRLRVLAIVGLVAMVVAGAFVAHFVVPSPYFAAQNRAIGSNVSVSGTMVPNAIKVLGTKANRTPFADTQPLGPMTQITPSGKLPALITLHFKLSRPVKTGEVALLVTSESPGGPWTLLQPAISRDGWDAGVQTDHLSWWQPLWFDLKAAASDFKKEVLDGLSGDMTTTAEQPHCDKESQARQDNYLIASSAKDTLYWCFGVEDGARVLKIVNRMRYPLEVSHSGFTVKHLAGPTLDLDQLARLGSGQMTILYPFEEADYTVNLPPGGQALISTAASGYAQSLYQLEFGVTTLLNVLTRFGYGAGWVIKGKLVVDQFSMAAEKMDELLSIKECANALNELNAGTLISGCFSPADIMKAFGWKGLVLAPLMAIGPLVEFFRSELNFLGDQLNDRDKYQVLVSVGAHITASPTPPPTGLTPTPTPAPPTGPTPTPTSVPVQTTYAEQEGHYGANTFTNPYNASGMGPNKIPTGAWVQVSCKVYVPAIQSANPDGYWYRIASSPWNNAYYAVANTFMNGDPWGGPYTHNTDFNVPDC